MIGRDPAVVRSRSGDAGRKAETSVATSTPRLDGRHAGRRRYLHASSPAGIHGGKNDDSFRAQIPIGYGFYRSMGTRSMDITSLELTQLDEYHWMAKAHWDSRYAKEQGGEERIEFDVIYFLQAIEESVEIFAYVTGDEEKALREKGLMPG